MALRLGAGPIGTAERTAQRSVPTNIKHPTPNIEGFFWKGRARPPRLAHSSPSRLAPLPPLGVPPAERTARRSVPTNIEYPTLNIEGFFWKGRARPPGAPNLLLFLRARTARNRLGPDCGLARGVLNRTIYAHVVSTASSPMRIALVNSQDIGGGAAGFARQLAQGLIARGHEVALVVGLKRTDLPWVHEVPVTGGGGRLQRWLQFMARCATPAGTPKHRLRHFARRILHAQEWRGTLARRRGFEDFRLPGSARSLAELPFRPDVVHLNNLHYFVGPTHFDLRTLPAIARAHRLVYTLHDSWAFTGHCAYFLECNRWRQGCGSCPHLDIYPALARDESAANWQTKARVYRQLEYTLTTPSAWLMACARESILAPAIRRSAVVPYGIDLDFFRPTTDPEAARRAWGVAPEERVLCFVADGGRATLWRDFGFVEKLVGMYQRDPAAAPLVVLEVGGAAQNKTVGKVRYIGTGRLPAEGVRQVFHAADLMVYPARADNFPYVILEALACGTPVLATRVGGLPEQFVDGESGFLFVPGDIDGASHFLARFLRDPAQRARMSAAARHHAAQSYAIDRMVSDYERIYAGEGAW
jgi:glycosyltransferase involved in cell wall biosynthesis